MVFKSKYIHFECNPSDIAQNGYLQEKVLKRYLNAQTVHIFQYKFMEFILLNTYKNLQTS